ncbi:S8 family serine peptidase [Paenibacillus oleatilyticus]|uniref:S8 family serine peptidase n=1 Tax=Paenibacillus oleatilyticus TaxID=2594886 RepID=UPI001C1F49B5|nr:S8 family serine peptidase [Paenibacillus oleatilyticus]MBU7318323.1 S8 family serine peptidase [Paenibacillus oleatilyticus]
MKDINRVKIAIVDSGIDTTNDSLMQRVAGGISIWKSEEGFKESADFADLHGHGTYCASVIKRMAPDALFFVVKVLDQYARTSSPALIESLRYLLETDVKLINISAATTEDRYKRELSEICKKLADRGKIAVSSLANAKASSYPASFPSVIGVQGIPMPSLHHYWYNPHREIQCAADSTPVGVRAIDGSFAMFGGNSKAAALFTGIICRKLQQVKTHSHLELATILECQAERVQWTEDDIALASQDHDCNHPGKHAGKHELSQLANILAKHLAISPERMQHLYQSRLYSPAIGLAPWHVHPILKEAETVFQTRLDYEAISLHTFRSIYSLLDFILKEKGVQKS